MMQALPTMNVSRDEYAPRSTGVMSVSVAWTRTYSSGTPSSSAAMYATMLLLPCPISDAPVNTATRPLRSIWICTADCGISFG
jgi:hypothetical protein